MKFRDYEIDDIIVVDDYNKKEFVEKLKKIHDEYVVIDLQYSTEGFEGSVNEYSALVLVRNKK